LYRNEKNEIKPWLHKQWCIPEASPEYVCKMEEILDVYQRPYDPLKPVVCIDETSKQLIKQTRIPCAPHQPEKVDYEYERNGVVNVFMIFEPLAGKRETIVSETRKTVDFANVLKYMSDVMYPHAETIVLVTDNLNTHSKTSLYATFTAEEAHRVANRIEWHYTPKHASWLDMAEIEIGIMSRQALSKPIPDMDSFKKQIKAWTKRRNEERGKVNWQFTTKDARVKLKKLYPKTL
jgi:transposase